MGGRVSRGGAEGTEDTEGERGKKEEESHAEAQRRGGRKMGGEKRAVLAGHEMLDKDGG